jgi:hypothetical protein
VYGAQVDMLENPCVTCLVGMICTNRCLPYHQAIKEASLNLFKWSVSEINHYRNTVGADFLHAVDNEIKRRVLFRREWRIRE